jgi:putative flippase GtrA
MHKKNGLIHRIASWIMNMRLARYFCVGGIAAVVDIGLFFLFASVWGFNYLLVGAGSFTVAAVVNYQLTIRHVFASGTRFTRRKEFVCVYLVSFMGLLLNQGILYLAVDIFSLDMMLSKCMAIGLVFFWNYLARKHFVFRPCCIG